MEASSSSSSSSSSSPSPCYQYHETGATLFSNSSFTWRKLNIGVRDVYTQDSTDESPSSRGAGAFYYQGSSQISSPCRNRTLIWRHDNHCIHLLEVSLDHDLVNNTLLINVSSSSYGTIMGDVTIHELASHMVVLFQTTKHVFRLVLPHPDMVTKDTKLFAEGRGLHPSILSFAREESFTGTNSASAFPPNVVDQSSLGITCASSWIGMGGVAMFVYGLASSGGIHCVRLPPPGATGLPEKFELNDKSMVTKIWNLIPTGIRGGSGDDVYRPTGLTLHSFGGELIILALYRNATLKLWSVQQKDCLMVQDLTQYLPSNLALDNAKLTIYKSHTTSVDSLQFAVYFGHSTSPQLSIFQLVLIDKQLVLDFITSHLLEENHVFIDLSLCFNEWWMTSIVDEMPAVTCCSYMDRLNPSLNTVSMRPFPSTDVVLGEVKDPRETYLDAIFDRDKFSSETILRALKLYGSSNDQALTGNKLRTEVIEKIEKEIAVWSKDVSDEEYVELVIKCWNKFYTCCLQYEKLVRTPVGVACDPATGIVAMIQQGGVSFIHSRRSCMSIDQEDCLHRAKHYLHDNLPEELFSGFMIELNHSDPSILVDKMADTIIHSDQSSVFVNGLLQIVSGVNTDDFNTILSSLHPVEDPSDYEDTEGALHGEHLTIADLFSSSLSTRLMGGAIADWSHDMIETCRDMILVLLVMKHFNIKTKISISELPELMSKFESLLINYQILYWLSSTVTTPTNQSVIDSNIKMLTNLRITDHMPMIYSMKRDVSNCSVMELFVSTYGRGFIIKSLLSISPFKPNVPVFAYWRELLPWLLDQLLRNSWPESMFITLYQLLIAEGQYFILQQLHSKLLALESSSNDNLMINSRLFLLGQSYLGMGETMKGCQCFVEASDGLETEPLLRRVCKNDGGYWTVCMRLPEEASATEGVIQLLEHATSLQDTESIMPLLWSNLFKHSLDVGLHQKAYYAMINNPDPEKREECLKHFVIVLTGRMKMKELCSYTYCGMEEKVEHVMELRARSVDVFDEHRFYDLMYCYHLSREKYWKAAHVMYEYGLRCGLEGKSIDHIKQECDGYAACLNSLHVVDSKYHWIVLPVEQSHAQQQQKGKNPSNTAEVNILKLRDIEVKFNLVESKLILLRRIPSLSSQLCNPYVSCEEVQTLLCQHGMFDDALRLSVNCKLSLVPVFESLATKCAILNFNTLSLSDDLSLWEWLSYNDQYSDTATAESRSTNIVDHAWNMLHAYLRKYPTDYQLLKAVTSKLLSLGCHLPQWLINMVKLCNPDGLFRVYLKYDLLPQAVELALDYMDAVMGVGSEQFGIKNTLHVTHPPVWLPYTAIDQLVNILNKNHGNDPKIDKLKENLDLKIQNYIDLLRAECDQTKQMQLLL